MNYKTIAEYLPHAAPMIFLDRVELIEKDHIICCVEISDSGVLSPFLNENKQLPSYYFIEMMAQTIGVWNGYHADKEKEVPKIAFLLGSRSFETEITFVPHGKSLKILANLILQDDNIANFKASIMIDNHIVASAKLNVYQPTEAQIEVMLSEKSE